MKPLSPYTMAAIGSVLIGAGVAFLYAAARSIKAEPCENCGEEGAAEVAAASAEISEEPAGD